MVGVGNNVEIITLNSLLYQFCIVYKPKEFTNTRWRTWIAVYKCWLQQHLMYAWM